MTALLYHSRSVGVCCRRVKEAAEQTDKLLLAHDTDALPTDGLVIRWDSRSPDQAGVTYVNTEAAVRLSRNKRLSREALAELAPATWFCKEDIQFPCVIRPRRHRAGKKFYVCTTAGDYFHRALIACKRGWYTSELVNKAKEYRVFILKGKVICCSERIPKDDQVIAWNLAMGNRLINLPRRELPAAVKTASIEAMKRLGLDWGAVDICISTEGKPLVFEVNTAPGLRNPYTIKKIARAFSKL